MEMRIPHAAMHTGIYRPAKAAGPAENDPETGAFRCKRALTNAFMQHTLDLLFRCGAFGFRTGQRGVFCHDCCRHRRKND